MVQFLSRVLRLAAPHRVRLTLGILFGILAGFLEPLAVFTVTLVYTVIFQDPAVLAEIQAKLPVLLRDYVEAGATQLGGTQMNSRLAFLIVATVPLVFFLRGLTTYLNVYLLQWVSIRTSQELRIRLFEHFINMPASFFTRSRSAELMSRLLVDTEALRGTISNSLSTLIKDPVTIVVMFAGLFWQAPKLTIMSMVVLPICIVPISVYSRKGRKAAAKIQELAADLSNTLMESFTGHRVVRAYNLESVVTRDFAKIARTFFSQYMRMIRSLEIPGPLLEFAGSVGIAILLGYAVVSTGPDRPTGRDFLFLIVGIIAMYRPLKSVVRVNASLQQARAASERVFTLLATKSALPEPANPKPLNAAGADIEFDNVNFSYDEKPVLHGISLNIRAGKLYALVGASGSGKTTLTNLLMRFYDVNSGAVRIGNTDIREVSTKSLRDQIAVVTQETVLFNDTIRNNIALGRPGATDDEIISAAKHAHAHEFIIRNQEGYNLVIGERGVRLSVGQRQRLTIARAILRNAPILILDEATSALDNESERIVQAALEELMVERTTICIAHRLSTIQKADVIVAMHEGRIAEMGTHAELLAKKGVYYKLNQLSERPDPGLS